MNSAKCFYKSDLKLAAVNSQTISKWEAKDEGHAWPDGNSTSHFPLLCFTAQKNPTFFAEALLFETVKGRRRNTIQMHP